MFFHIKVVIRVDGNIVSKSPNRHDRQRLGEETANRITDELRYQRGNRHTGIPHGEKLVHTSADLVCVSAESMATNHLKNIPT